MKTSVLWAGVILIGLLVLVVATHQHKGIFQARESSGVHACRSIELAMFSYACDHGGKYPEGKSSTEVFQKLIDEDYIGDPTLFYLPIPGKIKPVKGELLRPENVGWDVSCCVDSNSPDSLPLVFMTGFKVDYVSGGNAVHLAQSYPLFLTERTWREWWNGEPSPTPTQPGIVVAYKSNSVRFTLANDNPNSESIIRDFVPPEFDPHGKTYHQLTPDGTLP